MSTVPPPPPPPNPFSQQPQAQVSPDRAIAELAGPSIGLMVTAIIGACLQAFGLFINMLGAGLSSFTAGGREEQLLSYLSGGFGVVSSAIGLLIAGLIIYASIEMRNLRNWGLAMAASILAMVPCISPCCIIGLPMGIWSLVVLQRPDIKAAFR